VGNGPLDYKYKIIFKSKSNGKMLIDGWDVKIEENWEKINWEDPFSITVFLALSIDRCCYIYTHYLNKGI
jgi:hypothetical protein